MAASNVKYLACLFSLLLFPGICLSGAVKDDPAAEYEEVVRDSAVLFRFVPTIIRTTRTPFRKRIPS